MKQGAKLAITCCCFLLFFGCKPSQNSSQSIHLPTVSEANPKGRLVLNIGAEPTFFNPLLYTDSASATVVDFVFNGLIAVNEKLEFIPDLASQWDISDNGLIYTFHLRPNVFWHDGKPFTANDVKFTFDTLLSPKTQTVRRSSYIINGKPIKVTILDLYTVQFTLPEPFAPILSALSIGILPQHILEKQNINTTKFNEHPIGTGPFKLISYERGDHILLERNPNYFKGAAKLEKVYLKIIPNENSAKVAFETGQLDETSVQPRDFSRFQQRGNYNLFRWSALNYTYMGLNLDHAVLKELAVRQAIAHAINRDQLVNSVLRQFGQVANIPMAPASWAFTPEKPLYNYSPSYSIQLLNNAGWELGTNGYRHKKNIPCEFRLMISQGNNEREQAALIIQDALKKVGIKVQIQTMEWASLVQKLDQPKKDFDAVIIGWSLGIDPDSYSIWHSSQYPNGLNFVHYNNTTVDALLVKARREMIPRKRKDLYQQTYNHIVQDVPYIFLWYPDQLVATQRYIGGISPKPGPMGLFVQLENVFSIR